MAPGYREPHGALARKGVVMTVTAGRRPGARAPRPGPGRRCHDARQDPDLHDRQVLCHLLLKGRVSPVVTASWSRRLLWGARTSADHLTWASILSTRALPPGLSAHAPAVRLAGAAHPQRRLQRRGDLGTAARGRASSAAWAPPRTPSRCAEGWTRHALQARRSHLVKAHAKMLAATRKAPPNVPRVNLPSSHSGEDGA
jgi:hypothetical protein